MGGGNGQKSKMARERNMEKNKPAKGSQLESNKKAMNIQFYAALLNETVGTCYFGFEVPKKFYECHSALACLVSSVV
ncbi:SERF family protein [Spatholobus suberectus]|nr:SERF family protein [Spatholobus suberectus]